MLTLYGFWCDFNKFRVTVLTTQLYIIQHFLPFCKAGRKNLLIFVRFSKSGDWQYATAVFFSQTAQSYKLPLPVECGKLGKRSFPCLSGFVSAAFFFSHLSRYRFWASEQCLKIVFCFGKHCGSVSEDISLKPFSLSHQLSNSGLPCLMWYPRRSESPS